MEKLQPPSPMVRTSERFACSLTRAERQVCALKRTATCSLSLLIILTLFWKPIHSCAEPWRALPLRGNKYKIIIDIKSLHPPTPHPSPYSYLHSLPLRLICILQHVHFIKYSTVEATEESVDNLEKKRF